MHLSAEMHLKIKISMFEQLSKPLKMDGIDFFVKCILFHFYIKCAHGHMATRKHGKMITYFFGSKFYFG
jgi:hypothetical protein